MSAGDRRTARGRGTLPPALSGVRARSAMLAALVVAVALAVACGLLLVLLQRTLMSDAEQTAITRARQLAVEVRVDGVAGVRSELGTTTQESQLVQVLDPSGTVLAASSPRAAAARLADVRAGDGQVRTLRSSRRSLLDQDEVEYLVVVTGVRRDGVLDQVVVGTSLRPLQRSVQTVLSLLLGGYPVLVAVVAIATWALVGRSLRPVERIRARVAGMGGGRIIGRVPVPPSRDEIARLAETMNELLGRIEEAQAAQRRFVADASHELRSPLATLSAALELAEADGSDGTELRAVMSAETERLGRLVEGLLLLARVDENAVHLATTEVDLDDLIGDAAARLRTRPHLRVSVRMQPVRVEGDPARLGQVVTNLSDNAARYARSTVWLELSAEPDGARLVVEDDGPGIPPDQRERVFERFVRLDESRERTSGGSGLGLAIVRELVRAHGGSVTIGDGRSGGCRVDVVVPAVPPPAPPEGDETELRAAQAPSAARQ